MYQVPNTVPSVVSGVSLNLHNTPITQTCSVSYEENWSVGRSPLPKVVQLLSGKASMYLNLGLRASEPILLNLWQTASRTLRYHTTGPSLKYWRWSSGPQRGGHYSKVTKQICGRCRSGSLLTPCRPNSFFIVLHRAGGLRKGRGFYLYLSCSAWNWGLSLMWN